MRAESFDDEDVNSFADTLEKSNVGPVTVLPIPTEITIKEATSLRCNPGKHTELDDLDPAGGSLGDLWDPQVQMPGRKSPQMDPWKAIANGRRPATWSMQNPGLSLPPASPEASGKKIAKSEEYFESPRLWDCRNPATW